MIVRTVHNHLPENQLSNPLFHNFISSKKNKKTKKLLILIKWNQ